MQALHVTCAALSHVNAAAACVFWEVAAKWCIYAACVLWEAAAKWCIFAACVFWAAVARWCSYAASGFFCSFCQVVYSCRLCVLGSSS